MSRQAWQTGALEPEELVRWCQRTLPEDTRAFEVLVSQYKSRVMATAYRLMADRQDAEDAVQEVFLKVYRTIKGLDEPANLTAWIYRITTNTCLDALAKRKRHRQSTVPMVREDGGEETEMDIADASNATPEEAVLKSELQRCLEETLRQMDVGARATLVLRDVEDRPYQEIADTLKVGLSAVKMRIHRARLLFQETLNRICPNAWLPGRGSGMGA
jgi:RNA polymerase sigma-70 factor (ECF subfamily)